MNISPHTLAGVIYIWADVRRWGEAEVNPK